MSKNINQVFIANPITSNASTDLMYFGQSPYGAGNDAAMTYVNFAAQFGAPYTASALTSSNDTNVTITLGGTPATALLHAASLTMGWTGQLSGTRGGTGVNNGANTATFAGNLNFANSFTTSGNFAVTQTYTGATNVTFPTSGTLATTSQIPTGAALTEVNDTNVTLTLGGSPSTALVNAASLTLGWTGQLGLTRGGTNASLTASNGGIVYSTSSAMAILSGTATANLPLLSGSSTSPTWGAFALSLGGALTTAGAFTTVGAFGATFTFTNTTSVTFPTSGTLATTSQIPTGAALTEVNDTNVTMTLGGSPSTALVNAASMTLGWTGQLSLTRGGTNASLTASNGGIVYSTASAMAILAGTATANQVLLSGSSTTPAWSTATYPATTTINQILFSSSANTIGGITTANSAYLFTNSSGVPAWTASATNGQLLIGSTGASPALATLTAGTNISISNGAASITINTTGLASFSWTDVTGTSQTMAANNGYIADNAGLVTLTLPTTAAQGTLISVCGNGAGGWSIAQNASQNIKFGTQTTTTGTGGSLSSSNRYDQVDILCTVANTTWVVRHAVGNLTYV